MKEQKAYIQLAPISVTLSIECVYFAGRLISWLLPAFCFTDFLVLIFFGKLLTIPPPAGSLGFGVLITLANIQVINSNY